VDEEGGQSITYLCGQGGPYIIFLYVRLISPPPHLLILIAQSPTQTKFAS